MKKTDEEFINILCKQCNIQNIDITENKAKKLLEYKKLLLEWNEKINLTAITDDYEIIIKHFVDCLECTKAITNEKKIIDVGTGAGFPGIVLAIYYPEIEFTLLDALNKRIMFLQDVIEKLDIKNVKLVHARAEEYIRIENKFECFDASVSRAVANLPVLLEYVSPYVKVGGYSIVMKGDSVEDEIKLAQNALKTLNLRIEEKIEYSYNVNGEEYRRNILKIQKNNSTPKKYPRNYGQIKKKSL